jgi:hypothetical protein
MKDLLTEIKSRNIKAKAWMEANPGSWSGMYPEDEAYWIERGITNLVELERDELATYIYEGHKDAYGTKGRHYNFEAMTTQELKNEADRISVAVNEQMELEAKWETEAVSKFETSIKKYMDMGQTRKDAIRWILQAEELDNEKDASYICYSLGLPYSMETEFKEIA